MMAPQNVFDHCVLEMLRRRKLKLGDLIYLASKKVIVGSLGYLVLPWQRVSQGVLEIF